MLKIRSLVIVAVMLAAVLPGWSETVFDDVFDARTLRLDYIFGGNDSTSSVYLADMAQFDGWYGRRHHLERPLLRGNGAVTVTDKATGDTIYANSFSTLFQEWQNYDEALTVPRAFQHTVLVPMPRNAAEVSVVLYNNRGDLVTTLTHPVDPKDKLIRTVGGAPDSEVRDIHLGTNGECVDLVVLAEGYTTDERDKFFADAQRAADALFSHEPFRQMADRFSLRAIFTPSQGSGPSVPHEGDWHGTAHKSHYDTFYIERYLTTRAIHGIYDAIADVPCEHVILLVNTPRYGGGGIFNQITVATSDHPTFKQVLVHEFGHAYAGLGDEYSYGVGDEDRTYPVDVEPWEPNITTLVDFDSKWADMLPKGTKIPTEPRQMPPVKQLDPTNKKDAKLLRDVTQRVGVFEGAGYKAHGVYRPVQECRMKVNEVEYFCPVCTRAIERITLWYTE